MSSKSRRSCTIASRPSPRVSRISRARCSARRLPRMQRLITLIETYGLVVVFLNVLAETAGLPLPAYPALIVAAALAWRGDYSLGQLFLVAVSAALIADSAWYWAGKRYGRKVLNTICRVSLSPDFCVR